MVVAAHLSVCQNMHIVDVYICACIHSNLQMYEYKYNVVVYVIPAYSLFISR